MVPTVDRTKATVMTKIRFRELDPRILPDMSAKVAFLSRPLAAERAAQPRPAVDAAGGRRARRPQVVFVVQDDKAVRTPVRDRAAASAIWSSWTQGPQPGDKVVLRPSEKLRRRGCGASLCARSEPATAYASRRPMSSQAIVEIRNLSKAYRRGDQVVPVLTDINLDVDARRVRRADGAIRLGQEHAAQSDRRHRQAQRRHGCAWPGTTSPRCPKRSSPTGARATSGFIFQFYNLMPVLTAFENVELPLLLTGLSARERREHVAAALRDGRADRPQAHYPSELSGGQQQRVAIARAIITDPTILVADEPTGDLDRESAADVLELMDQLNGELGKTIIMVTHDQRAAGAAQRLVHLDKGVLISD